MYIIDYKFCADAEALAETRPLHIDYLKPFYAEGLFIIGGRKADATGGVILARDMERQDIEDILVKDPFIMSGAATFTLQEFSPVMHSKDGEMLVG